MALGYFFVLKVCGHNEAAIELAAAVLIKPLQQHGHEFCDETQLLVKKMLYM